MNLNSTRSECETTFIMFLVYADALASSLSDSLSLNSMDHQHVNIWNSARNINRSRPSACERQLCSLVYLRDLERRTRIYPWYMSWVVGAHSSQWSAMLSINAWGRGET